MDLNTTEERLFDPFMVFNELYTFIFSMFRLGVVTRVSNNGKKVNLNIQNAQNPNQNTGFIPVLQTGSSNVLDYKKPVVGDRMLFISNSRSLSSGYALPFFISGSQSPDISKDWHVSSENFDMYLDENEFKAEFDDSELLLNSNRVKLSKGNSEVVINDSGVVASKGSNNINISDSVVTVNAGGSTFTFSSGGFAVNGVTLMVP
ncbi:hypothetical protein [Cognatishimia sp.]|uniref:hypothetical protein n=1 Tax=Cognatishimia sp. TaxID=2211648 RepID=UPI0035191609|nr:hypothetical protein [Cognatishimia sp.]